MGCACLAPILALALASCGEPEAPYQDARIDRTGDEVVAVVEGTPVYLSDVQRLAVGQERVGAPEDFDPDSEGFDDVRDELVDQRVLALAARSQQLDMSPEASRRRALFEERMLGNLLVETHLESTVTDEALRELYERQLVLREPVPQVRARHLLVETRAEAETARERIAAGEDFADVAAEVSLDAATAATGGELDWFTRDSFAREFTDAAFATEPGKLSVPVETDLGWHVIKVEETREDVPPTFAELRDELRAFLTYDEIEALMTRLREEADVVFPEAGTVETDGEAVDE